MITIKGSDAVRAVKEMNKNPEKFREIMRGIIDQINICKHCNCMTHTIKGKCGKCNGGKYE